MISFFGSIIAITVAAILMIRILRNNVSRSVVHNTFSGRLLFAEFLSCLIYSILTLISSVCPSELLAKLFVISAVIVIRLGFAVYVLLSETIRGANMFLTKATLISMLLGASYVTYANSELVIIRRGGFWERYPGWGPWWTYDAYLLAVLCAIGVISTLLTTLALIRHSRGIRGRVAVLKDFILLYAPPIVGMIITILLFDVFHIIGFDGYKVLIYLLLIMICLTIYLALKKALYPLYAGSSQILLVVVLDFTRMKKVFEWSSFIDKSTIDAIVGLVWGSDDIANSILNNPIERIELKHGTIIFAKNTNFIVILYVSQYIDIYKTIIELILSATEEARTLGHLEIWENIRERLKPFIPNLN